ncbi:DUF1329 domain-containing protein [Pseudofulvimonas gallinarii]|jgi:hypothetical protein|uniref:Uncharacterized protein DUF1329 n=1 Tax=Pseudofulvimonas gallinarii TaxID=634155 RepID=A0A4R3LFN4_9GAMM|nr:DUF1329 domain-containing protein [Pseudofulvimonas gallinarii]TCS98849.1 uncharacterized protein DUF1329 [Pseudofulvimonas gallinarii]THD14331.1 outer membrane lipoprotein-sorting protein [Pseudofulvimonas gallinarii]
MRIRHSVLTTALAAALVALPGIAAVPQSEADRLGSDLTPLGGEAAGNGGAIPAWDGGVRAAPSGVSYTPGQFHPDPFASDSVQFTINRGNLNDYAANLTEGQKAMFARYESFEMNVYPTRRSAAFPQRIYDMTKRNATTARLVADGDGVADAAEGIPFPIPQNGHEVIWNHKLKWKGVSSVRYNNQAPVTSSGSYNLVRLREDFFAPYETEGRTIADINNILLYFYQSVEAPPRLAGQLLLVHESLNQAETPRQAWVYNPGQRRVRRAPNVAYDNPGTASDNLRTSDMTDMFNGALDRFDWQLVGKKEIYVPYNSYKAHGAALSDLIQPGHLNPDLLRYELHRVWVVDARLKSGARHINSRRTFYVDEDSWQILIADHYDSDGNLWRYSEAPSISYYEMPLFWSTLETHHDLKNGRYLATGLDNAEGKTIDYRIQFTADQFSPQNLRNRGVR